MGREIITISLILYMYRQSEILMAIIQIKISNIFQLNE